MSDESHSGELLAPVGDLAPVGELRPGDDFERCKRCGGAVVLMTWKGTELCSPLCAKKWSERQLAAREAGRNGVVAGAEAQMPIIEVEPGGPGAPPV